MEDLLLLIEINVTTFYIFQDRVTIVDTPGIGEGDENHEMTKRLMNYLPNAVAFIYVINSSNAGGLQNDRVSIGLGNVVKIDIQACILA